MKNVKIMISAVIAGAAVSAMCATTNGIGKPAQFRAVDLIERKVEPAQSGKDTPKAAASKKVTYKENAALIKGFLDADEWKYEMEDKEDKILFSGGITGEEGIYDSYRFVVTVDDSVVQGYALLPASAKKKLAEMGEFITRANYGLKYGAFEMDYSDGEVRYHICLPIEAFRADRDKFAKLILVLPVQVMEKYAKGIAAVLIGVKTPKEAVEECEKDD
ncbi:MAG: hypothetical protein IJR99_01570 [Kiritimatiellae bacterium]|nr:hypothetical protein [Kiritimatiellia bacterium]